MRWRSEVVLAVTLFGSVAPHVAVAQATAPSPLCACFVGKPPGPGTPGIPGVPGTVPPGGTPGENPGGLPEKDGGDVAPWAFLGAAGLALLSGVPFGGGGVQGPLFGALPVGPGGLDGPAHLASGPNAPIERAGVADLSPAPVNGPSLMPAGSGAAPATALGPADPILDAPRLGRVPPKTATHLPLFGALGVLMTAAGLLLARRSERQRRRRRRLIAT